ncbi:MAG: hypothetical protein WDA07_06520 [Leucobacter sp.]
MTAAQKPPKPQKPTKAAQSPAKARSAPKAAAKPAREDKAAKRAKYRAAQAEITKEIEESNREWLERTKRRPGRPSIYTPELWKEFLRRISGGRSMRKVCSDPDMPGTDAIWEWITTGPRDNGEVVVEGAVLAAQYAQARQERADALVEEILDIADDQPTPDNWGNIDKAHVEWQKLRIETRKWVAARMRPTLYGDRIEVKQTGQVTFQLGIQRQPQSQLSAEVVDVDAKPLTGKGQAPDQVSGLPVPEADAAPREGDQ